MTRDSGWTGLSDWSDIMSDDERQAPRPYSIDRDLGIMQAKIRGLEKGQDIQTAELAKNTATTDGIKDKLNVVDKKIDRLIAEKDGATKTLAWVGGLAATVGASASWVLDKLLGK